MKTFRSLPQRLLLLIGLALGLTLISTAAYLISMRQLLQTSRLTTQQAVNQFTRSQSLLMSLANEHSLLQNLLRQRDADELEKGLGQLEKAAAELRQQIGALSTQATRSGADAASLSDLFHKVEVAQKVVLEPLLLGNNAAAYEVFLRDYTPQYARLLEQLDAHINHVGRTVRDQLDQQDRSAARKGVWSLIVATGLLLLVGHLSLRLKGQIVRELGAVAHGLHLTSESTALAAAQVSSSSQSLAQGASEQAASLEETSASLEELTAMTQRNAANAQQARQLATQTRQAVEAGQHDMSQLARAMDDIQQASSEISKIIKTIDEIAFQTNLLALNAAVEAARAGEAGMGFAVVADEVRALAQRAAAAARETAEKIENSVAKSQTGAQMSQRVAQHLQDILAKARQVDELVAEIAAASQEQSQGISQINAAVSQMDKVTQANAAAAEQSAATAQELNAQAASLRQAVLELQALVGSTQTQFQGTAEESGSEVPAELPAQPRLRELRVTPGPVGESWVGRGSNGAREVQSQLTKAMATHGAWKRRLEEAIQTGKSDITPERASVDDQCEFGKWLYSLPRQLRESATWQKVRTLHADFHREAGRVLQLALTGRKTEAKAAMSHGGAFTLRSAELIRALQQWKSSSPDSTKGVRATPMPSAVGSGPATILKASEANGDFVDDPIPMPPPEEHPKPRF